MNGYGLDSQIPPKSAFKSADFVQIIPIYVHVSEKYSSRIVNFNTILTFQDFEIDRRMVWLVRHMCALFSFSFDYLDSLWKKNPSCYLSEEGLKCDWLDRSVSPPDQAFQMAAEPGEPGTQAGQPAEAARTDFAAYRERPAPFHQGRAPG